MSTPRGGEKFDASIVDGMYELFEGESWSYYIVYPCFINIVLLQSTDLAAAVPQDRPRPARPCPILPIVYCRSIDSAPASTGREIDDALLTAIEDLIAERNAALPGAPALNDGGCSLGAQIAAVTC